MAAQPMNTYDRYIVDIVEYFYSEPTFSDYARFRARLVILDSVGCAIETVTQSPQCRQMLGPIPPNTNVPTGCRLPGTGFALDPVKAAFDLGAMIRYLDHNDGYTGQEWGHPSDMLGAILAVADCQTRIRIQEKNAVQCHEGISFKGRRQPIASDVISISQLIEATIKAFEVHCLFQHTNSFNQRGLDHTILVKIGATVAVCWLQGFPKDRCLAALSQVFQDGGMLRTYRQAPNTGPRKGWAAGDACMRAVHLAWLTGTGQPGAPTVLSDPKWGFYRTLYDGKSFSIPQSYGSLAIENNGFKLVAAEGHGISACNAAVIVSEHLSSVGLSTSDISGISIRTMKPAVTIIDKHGPLRNPADRDHCLNYMVAVSIIKGALPQAGDYADDSGFASSVEIERLRQLTTAYEDAQLTADYFDPAKRTLAAGLTVTLSSGDKIGEVLVEAPLGHAKNPDTNAAVLIKFHENMGLAFESSVAERAVAALEDDDLLVSEFMDIFWKGSGGAVKARL